jgi:hypothetical protein
VALFSEAPLSYLVGLLAGFPLSQPLVHSLVVPFVLIPYHPARGPLHLNRELYGWSLELV